MTVTEKEPPPKTGGAVPSNLDPDLPVADALPNRPLTSYLLSLYLFTKNDFKTAVLPQALFALGVALSGSGTATGTPPSTQTPSPDPNQVNTPLTLTLSRLPLALLWSSLHLLVFTIANQRHPAAVREDAINKPWRPLPSGRLTPAEATLLLRGVAIPAAVLCSVALGNYTASGAWMICVWMYNDLGGHGAGPVERNFWNVVALGAMGWGASEVLMGGEQGAQTGSSGEVGSGSGVGGYDGVPRLWLLLTSAVVFTTVHAQDMEDVEGDKAMGRRTALLVYGEKWARWLLAGFAVLWSVVCPAFWKVSSVAVWAPTVCLGGAIAVLTTTRWDRASDKLVWNLWCVWMGVLYLLPIFS